MCSTPRMRLRLGVLFVSNRTGYAILSRCHFSYSGISEKTSPPHPCMQGWVMWGIRSHLSCTIFRWGYSLSVGFCIPDEAIIVAELGVRQIIYCAFYTMCVAPMLTGVLVLLHGHITTLGFSQQSLVNLFPTTSPQNVICSA